MEVFVRIAEEKFLKQGLAQNMAEATQKMLDEHLLQEINKYSAQSWRDNVYWNEKCDDCLKFYKHILDNVFKNYSVKKVKPG